MALTPEDQQTIDTPVTISTEAQTSVSVPENLTTQTQAEVSAPASLTSEAQTNIAAPTSLSAEAQTAIATPTSLATQAQPTIDAPTPPITLDLNFAKESYQVNCTRNALATAIDFSRATTSTYWGRDLNAWGRWEYSLKTAAIDEPCLAYDPATGESLGLQVFGASTNLLTYSEQFDNAAWTKVDSTINANSVESPDGTISSDMIEAGSTATILPLNYQESVVVPLSKYTFSLMAKKGSADFLQVTFATGHVANDPRVNFDLALGVVGSKDNDILSATISPVSNGFYLLSVTVSAATALLRIVTELIKSASDDRNQLNSWTAGDGLYIWGAQLEEQEYATPYIKTEASQETRAADIAKIENIDTAGWYNQSAGSVFVEYSTTASNTYISSLSDGSLNKIDVFINSDLDTYISAVKDGIAVEAGVKAGDGAKGDLVVCVGDSLTFNGVYSQADFSVPTVNKMSIGSSYNGIAQLGGYMKQLKFYPAKLSQAQQEALTK